MAYLAESSTWEAGTYQLETSDPVLGGAAGVSNLQGKQLGNRTRYLKDTLDAFQDAQAIVDEDLQDQIDELVANGIKFRDIVSIVAPYTLLTTDMGKYFKGNVAGDFETIGEFTLPAADALIEEGFMVAIANNMTSGVTPIIRTGGDHIKVGKTQYTTFNLDPGDVVILTNEPDSNLWTAVSFFKSAGFTPVGTVIAFAANTAPEGYLNCSGQQVSQTTYAALFALIGTTYNTGGETTGLFRLPEMRAEFIRGWDNSRGVDVDRDFGSYQDELVGPHQHPVNFNSASGSAGAAVGTLGSPDSSLLTDDPSGDPAENRPRNIALLYCIKF